MMSLQIRNTKKCVLTPERLLYLGAYDDFYNAYERIDELYSDKYDELRRMNRGLDALSMLDESMRKDVRQVCQPLIQNYINFFSPEITKIYANAHGFANFSFLYAEKVKKGIIEVRHIDFARFLYELEYAVIRIFSRWEDKENFESKYEQVRKETQHHILTTAIEARKRCEVQRNIDATDRPLFIYDALNRTSCYQYNHPVVAAGYYADVEGLDHPLLLPVHYCVLCKKYFMGKRSLALFEKKYGTLCAQKRYDLIKNDALFGLQSESKLHALGYNVIEGKMSEADRQKLLISLLESNRITYLEMCATIEQNITMFQNSYRHITAVQKWMADLKYLGQHILMSGYTSGE